MDKVLFEAHGTAIANASLVQSDSTDVLLRFRTVNGQSDEYWLENLPGE